MAHSPSVEDQNKRKMPARNVNYPKCVPIAKARSMSEGQRRTAVRRKRSERNTGGKPTNVKTFAKKKKEDGWFCRCCEKKNGC